MLNMHRINVEAETNRGRLKLSTRREWRQPGELDSHSKSEQVRGFIDDALKSGFDGVRFAIEMTWTLSPDISADKLEHWEQTLNTIFTPGIPGKIICQYNRHRLSASIINQAFLTHPYAIIEKCLCYNPFYEDRLILNEQSEVSRSEWMMSQFRAIYSEIMAMRAKNEPEHLSDSMSDNGKSNIIQVLGKKYSMFLLSLIGNNRSIRFSEIRAKLGGISSSTLSQRLDELEHVGLIKREVYPEVPPKVLYSLSKDGAKLLKTLTPLL